MTCGPNRTCHMACDCREAAHAEEVKGLREALRVALSQRDIVATALRGKGATVTFREELFVLAPNAGKRGEKEY